MIAAYLKKNNLIICPNSLKKKVIQEINEYPEFISYKIMDLGTFLQNYFFSYNKQTIYYLMQKLNLNYEIILEYLDAMYFIENKNYHSKKLNELKQLKEELMANQLLIMHPFFHYYLSHTHIILYGYGKLDSFYQNIFSNYSGFTEIELPQNNQNHTIYEFDNIEDEIAYICHDIKLKLDQEIPIQNIKILSPNNEYISPLKRIFTWCHLPLDLEIKTSLYDIQVGKDLLKKISDNKSFFMIMEEFQNEKMDYEILNQVVSILNTYAEFEVEPKKLSAMIEYDLKHTFLKKKQHDNTIHICDWNQIYRDDYIYILGFNKENYPTLYKDEEFLSDGMKKELGLFDSNQKNINSMNHLKSNLNQECHFTITYKLRTAFQTYNPCILIKEEGYSTIKNPSISHSISHFYNQITLAKEYDKFYKYGVIGSNMKMLRYHYPKLEYRTYQNQFTGIDNQELLSNLKKPFTLSYSTIDEYYHCAFRYYVSNILKLKDENIDEFYRNVGNIFHYVLSKCFDKNFDFETAWKKEASKYEFIFSKMILLEKLKQELKCDIEIINEQRKYSCFNEFLYEKKFSIPISNHKNIPVNFVGIVDKISYLKEENKTLVSITDYKTGHLPSNLNHMIYGIGMQLPIYLYFIKRSSLFPNLEIVGFYLQKVINKEMKRSPNKTLAQLKENALKLVGYSTDKEENLRKFDITYEDSRMISGLKKKNEGFYSYSKVLNQKQMENMDNLVTKKIEEATNDILNGNFSINPKKIEKELIGCEFCSYRDVCYKTEKDYVELEKHQNLDFLGGELDA